MSAIDVSKLVTLAQEFMAYLEANHSDDELVEVGIVAEIRNTDNASSTPTSCSSDSRVYQTGLFRWAADTVQWTGEPADDDVPPPEES